MNPPLDNLCFRNACRNDIPKLRSLYKQSLPDVATRKDGMANVLDTVENNPDNRTIVGLMDDQVVATCQVILYDNLVRAPKRKAVIDSVVVDETFRNIGIGTAMMEWVVALLRDEGCSHIGVASRFPRKVAHHMYKKLNFEQFGYYYLFRT